MLQSKQMDKIYCKSIVPQGFTNPRKNYYLTNVERVLNIKEIPTYI